MKATELRIGNWAYLFGDAVQLTREHLIYIFSKEIGGPEPITLTEEWLFKFGFKAEKVYDNVFDYWMPDRYHTKGHKVQTDGETFVFIGYKDGTEIEHVHQLQNLYFALTGEELELKTPIKNYGSTQNGI